MINDGFCDDLTVNEQIERYRRWAYKVAHSFDHGPGVDDFAQEGMIAMWRSMERHPDGVGSTYLTKAARYRMLGLAQGAQAFGGDPKPGPRSRPVEGCVDWTECDGSWDLLFSGSDLLSSAEMAYHHGEIFQFLNTLELRDREYIFRRFWEGKTDTEIAAELGVSNKYLGIRWKRTLLPKLEKALVHLTS